MANYKVQNIGEAFAIIEDKIKSGLDIGLYDYGKLLLEERKDDSRKPKSGNIYTNVYIQGRKTRKAKHISSLANKESSAELSGRKNRKSNFLVSGQKLTAGVSSSVDYAIDIEKRNQDFKKAYLATKDKLEEETISGIRETFKL